MNTCQESDCLSTAFNAHWSVTILASRIFVLCIREELPPFSSHISNILLIDRYFRESRNSRDRMDTGTGQSAASRNVMFPCRWLFMITLPSMDDHPFYLFLYSLFSHTPPDHSIVMHLLSVLMDPVPPIRNSGLIALMKCPTFVPCTVIEYTSKNEFNNTQIILPLNFNPELIQKNTFSGWDIQLRQFFDVFVNNTRSINCHVVRAPLTLIFPLADGFGQYSRSWYKNILKSFFRANLSTVFAEIDAPGA